MWLSEIRAGVYVGVYSTRTRERIWDETRALLGDEGSGVIVWAAPTDSGFMFDACGENRRSMVDVDGLTLVRFAGVQHRVEGGKKA